METRTQKADPTLLPNMDVSKVFHMTGGVGETSYARNSSLQKKASDMVKHIIMDTIQELYLKQTPKSLGIADLGCSSGPNTLSIIREIVESIEVTSRKMCHPAPEFRVYLNDLPTNDFNTIFTAVPDFYEDLRQGRGDASLKIFIAGVPGSFYSSLFPDKSLHFIHSSHGLHWLSRVPPALYDWEGKSINKRSIYICRRSPPMVCQAYMMQFEEDFSLFLQLRSKELVSGGRMVLILLGREGRDHVDRGSAFLWELLTQSFAVLVSQGDVSEEKVDSYDTHFYAPCKDEIEDGVRREGSFTMERLEMFEIERVDNDGVSYGRRVAMAVRAIQESMISHHFGGGIIDNLFDIYSKRIDEEMAKQPIKPISLVVVLRRD